MISKIAKPFGLSLHFLGNVYGRHVFDFSLEARMKIVGDWEGPGGPRRRL